VNAFKNEGIGWAMWSFNGSDNLGILTATEATLFMKIITAISLTGRCLNFCRNTDIRIIEISEKAACDITIASLAGVETKVHFTWSKYKDPPLL